MEVGRFGWVRKGLGEAKGYDYAVVIGGKDGLCVCVCVGVVIRRGQNIFITAVES